MKDFLRGIFIYLGLPLFAIIALGYFISFVSDKRKESEIMATQQRKEILQKEAEKKQDQIVSHYRNSPILKEYFVLLRPVIEKHIAIAKQVVFLSGNTSNRAVGFSVTADYDCFCFIHQDKTIEKHSFSSLGYSNLEGDKVFPFSRALQQETDLFCKKIDPRIKCSPISGDPLPSTMHLFSLIFESFQPHQTLKTI